MKKLSLLATFAVLALGSCSNDQEFENTSTSGVGNEINFRTFVDKGAASRATITNGNNLTGFTVTGWWEKKSTSTLATAQPEEYLFNAQDITRRETGITAWDYAPKANWPKTGNGVTFFAYAPNSSQGVTKGLNNYKGTEIAYTVKDPGANESQEDFLMANPGKLSSGTVKLDFAHALSRVKFFARTINPDVVYTIGSIELLDIYKSGEIDFANIPVNGQFTYGTPATPGTTVVHWAPTGTKGNVSLNVPGMEGKMDTEFKSITNETNALMVLPQETTMGNPTAKTGFLIKVKYKAVLEAGEDDIWYAGGPDKYEEKYFAVEDIYRAGKPHTFEIGRQYNFFLTFGDETGGKIDFEVGVGDWDDTYNSIHVPQIPDYSAVLSDELIAAMGGSTPITSADVMKKKSLEIKPNSGEKLTQASLKGLEYFENLEKIVFYETDGKLSLDLTGLKKVKTIDFSHNANFSKIDISNIVVDKLTFSINPNYTSTKKYTVTVDELVVWDGFKKADDQNYNSTDAKLLLNTYYNSPVEDTYILIKQITAATGSLDSTVEGKMISAGSKPTTGTDYINFKNYK